MNILFLTIDRSIRVATHFAQFQNALKDLATVTMVKRKVPVGMKAGQYARQVMEGKIKPTSINDSILNRAHKYDWIVTDADFAYVHEDWANINIPTAIIIEDDQPTGNCRLQMEWAKKNKPDIIFHKYQAFLKHYGDLDFNYQWLPHSIDIDFFDDYMMEKKYDVLMVGWHFEEIYPYRHKAYELLKDKSYFTEIERPHESPVGKEHENIGKWPVGQDYAFVLNQAKICITGGLIFDRPVMKYFETAAANSLIVSNWFDELGDLGFVPNENMVIADYDHLDLQMRALLANENWKPIAENGHKLVRERHNTYKRAEELIECLKKTKGK